MVSHTHPSSHHTPPLTLHQAANSQGIQTLLEAEKEAAKVVQKARQYRVQKLKDARSEAAKEIEEYKASKDAEFKKFESEVSGVGDGWSGRWSWR
jgi:ATP synthase subunit G